MNARRLVSAVAAVEAAATAVISTVKADLVLVQRGRCGGTRSESGCDVTMVVLGESGKRRTSESEAVEERDSRGVSLWFSCSLWFMITFLI